MADTTVNYSFKKRKIGHPVRDDDVGDNLDLIDAAIKAREDEMDTMEALADGKIIVGNGSDVATDVSMAGDITIDNSGNTTIGADKVSNTKLANMNQGTVKVGGSSDAPTDLDASGNTKMLIGDGTDINSVAVTGDVTITNVGVTAIGSDKVTSAKVAPTYMKVASGALAADASGNMAFIWQNPEDAKVLVHRVLVDRTTAGGSVGSELNVGVVDASGNTADNLIDGLDLNATGLADNITDIGNNGKSRQKLDEKDGTTDWITGKILVADASSLVGKYYIYYTEVAP